MSTFGWSPTSTISPQRCPTPTARPPCSSALPAGARTGGVIGWRRGLRCRPDGASTFSTRRSVPTSRPPRREWGRQADGGDRGPFGGPAWSPFLSVPEASWLASNELTFAFFDANPASSGHALVVPRRVVASWFETTAEEQAALLELVSTVKQRLDVRFHPDGYNVGFNDGEAAGQTVFHLHVHVIPRYRGDMTDPRGGMRHAVAGRGYYPVGPP